MTESDGERSNRTSTLALVVTAIASALGVLTSLIGFADFTVNAFQISMVAFMVSYVAAIIFAIRWRFRYKTVDLRVALLGQPEAGKTVFANLLFDILNNSPHNVGFTPDQKSAISVAQVLRGLGDAEWPPKTTTGSALFYRGTAEMGRRVIVDLEVVDTAGEHWIDLRNTKPGANDYLELVLSSGAFVLVISAAQLLEDAEVVARDLADMTDAIGIMRSQLKRGAHLGPLLVVVSQVDRILDAGLSDDLFQVRNADDAMASAVASSIPPDLRDDLAKLSRRLQDNFTSVSFSFSSHLPTIGKRRLERIDGSDFVEWLQTAALERVHPPRSISLLRRIFP